MTPRQQLDRRKSAALSIGSDGLYDGSAKGVSMGGNLADELADAWNEDGVEDLGSSFLEGLREGSVDPTTMQEEMCHAGQMDDGGFCSVRSPATPSRKPVLDHSWHSPTLSSGNVKRSPTKRQSRGESRYDCSDHGNNSDLGGKEGITPGLAHEMASIEGLARNDLNDDSVSEAGGVIPRTATALKDLGAQASIENGVTRIITAYTSITSHRTHKTREISSLAHSLLMDRAFTLSGDEIDDLIVEIDVLIQCTQLRGGPSPLRSLQDLMANTTDLTRSLGSLADILQESRQASSAAARRLKSVRDFVTDLRQEEEVQEEGIRYLERGDWDRRLRDREARRTCGDIVDGFETTCNLWRSRLFGTTAEATPA
jgi:hypothetical protein